MQKRRVLFFSSLVILIIAAYLLITGSSLLVKPLFKDSHIPMGTFITWVGVVALPLSIYLGIQKLQNPKSKKDIYMAKALKLFIVFAVLWVPISYLLAGNLSFSFTEKAEFQGGQSAMKLFWYYIYIIVGAPLLLLLFYGLASLFSKKEIKS